MSESVTDKQIANLRVLAEVLRREWWDNEAVLTKQGRELLAAAYMRVFPDEAHCVENCACEPDSEFDPEDGDPKCDECPTRADLLAVDAKLTAYIAANPLRPLAPASLHPVEA
jgi:hypothetical protein